MTFTVNKNIEQPAHNADINTWDVNVNANWAQIDASLGGVTTINVTGLSGVITLSNSTSSPPSYINPVFKVSGTLTNNVNYQFPSGVGGIFTVLNTTTGAFIVTFSSAGGGSSTVIPQGGGTVIQSDGTNVTIPVNYLAGLGVGIVASSSPLATKGNGSVIQVDGPASTGSASVLFTNNGTNHNVAVGYDIAGGQVIVSSPANSLCLRNDVAPIIFSTGGSGLNKMSLDNGGNLSVAGGISLNGLALGGNVLAMNGNQLVGGNVVINGNLQVNGSGQDIICAGITATAGTLRCTGFGFQTDLDFTGSITTSDGTGMTMTCVSGGVVLTNGATAWAAVSDETEKTDLTPITDALPKISALRAVMGRYKYEAPETSHPFLIAQDVQKVLPEAISEKGDGTLMLRYTDMIPLLVAALKEAREEISTLKARLDQAGIA